MHKTPGVCGVVGQTPLSNPTHNVCVLPEVKVVPKLPLNKIYRTTQCAGKETCVLCQESVGTKLSLRPKTI